MGETLSTVEARWADKPNELSLVLAAADCPHPQTSVTVLLTTPSRVVCVFVKKRGWDTPGGHIDEGESTLEAAVREVWEEAGLEVQGSDLTLLGWTHLELLCPKPDQYAYPYPHTYQPVYHCSLTEDQAEMVSVRMPEEISKVTLVLHAAAMDIFRGRDWLPLLQRVVDKHYPTT